MFQVDDDWQVPVLRALVLEDLAAIFGSGWSHHALLEPVVSRVGVWSIYILEACLSLVQRKVSTAASAKSTEVIGTSVEACSGDG